MDVVSNGREESEVQVDCVTILEDIRKEITRKVIEFSKDENSDKILLVTLPQGSGKSVTTAKTLLDNKINFIHLGVHHKFVHNLFKENDVLAPYNMFHLKGRNARVSPNSEEKMCINPLLEKIINCNIDINEFLCERCKYYENCIYRAQFSYLNETEESWVSVINFMNTKFFEEYPFQVLVLDENPLDGLSQKISFNAEDLKNLENIILKIINKNKFPQNSIKYITEGYAVLKGTTDALREIIFHIEKNITGIEFIKLFFKYFPVDPEMLERVLYREFIFTIFTEHYEKYVSEMFEDAEPSEYKDFKNIFYEILLIIKICDKYKSRVDSINIPIYLKKHKKLKNNITFYMVNKELPDKPVIILDASGEAELYQQLFDRDVELFNPAVDIERNIIQVTDGMYPKQSLLYYNDKTRLRVYNIISKIINYWIENGYKKVFIITHKAFGTITNANEAKDYKGEHVYIGKSIEQFLHEKGLDGKYFDIRHYFEMKGVNILDLMEQGKLIILGTPEPNLHGFYEDVCKWYEGEEVISNERITEPETSEFFRHDYRYVDKRYEAHLKIKREHLLEHNIERLRFIEPDSKKECILFTMLPIGYKTKKMSSKELLKMYGIDKNPKTANLRALKFVKDKGIVSFQDFGQKIRFWKGVKELGGHQVIRENLIRNGMVTVEEIKQKHNTMKMLRITEKGKKYVS